MLGTRARAAASVGAAALAWAAACGDEGSGSAGAGGQGDQVGCTSPAGPDCHPPVPHAGAGTGTSSSTGGSGPGGGGASVGAGEGGAGGSGGSPEPSAAGSGGSGPSGGSGGIEECQSGLTTGDAELDVCIITRCCDAYEACSDFGADPDACIACFEAGGGPLCDDAIACTEAECDFATAGICDSGASTGDGFRDDCLGEACCDAFRACTADGADVGACIACLEAGGGPPCDAAMACMDEASCGAGSLCDSGLTTGDPEQDACLSDACCDAFRACTTDGLDVDACIACFEAGGGPLCDDAMACAEESCGL